ncbi:hypothetical protein JG687_00016724 [Phytophthora cactorum]|uniref:Uncharacterized protein n=1 Tax=Phytophthora cactorum TaxID=29920 RepID=A0A329RCR7_9STRA|nr:hypothetical protein Pcac1_g17932 [Phytophthora cactorum]KAG2925403.1 hypothetical protein PC114_g4168 [Phytophthora cactorum]KAG2951703.1 hypothetical protein PC117_g3421 [Phytophthora cactorum]KAG2987155.1 hypothetical protein PC120_g23673 [Phytophthora cactorum]KAG3039419.1 hypothetical protein PC119_g2224 [Phytophthora cactorum]
MSRPSVRFTGAQQAIWLPNAIEKHDGLEAGALTSWLVRLWEAEEYSFSEVDMVSTLESVVEDVGERFRQGGRAVLQKFCRDCARSNSTSVSKASEG